MVLYALGDLFFQQFPVHGANRLRYEISIVFDLVVSFWSFLAGNHIFSVYN